MAIVNRRVSDLTGAEAAETEFGKMVVRRHPKLDAPVELDYLPAEIASMKPIAEVVVLELTAPDGLESEVLLTPNEFNKLAQGGNDMPTILAAARGTRGRRPKVN